MDGDFNVGSGDYNSAVAAISDAESSLVGERAATINLGEALENRIEIRPLPYDRAAGIIIVTEGGVAPLPIVPTRPTAPSGARRRPAAAPAPEAVEAAKEIKTLVGGAGKEYERKVSQEAVRVKKGGLVLPTLSVQDQISELEKISTGIDESIFNADMRKIVVDEVEGLSGVARGEKLENMERFQRDLSVVRNQRLEEVRAKLKLK